MQRYSRWLVYALLIFLAGCSLSPKEDARRAQAERACVDECKIKLAACKQRCTDSCKLCEKANRTQMIKRYKTYIHEQCVQGKRVALQLQSFYDPLQCHKTSCDCPADYRVCVGACRGKIRKYLQITPFCC
ncbi:MAG: acyltransferase [Legionellaceae bacterium]|nr:acyltransferase [Legionellaceae bacterium]